MILPSSRVRCRSCWRGQGCGSFCCHACVTCWKSTLQSLAETHPPSVLGVSHWKPCTRKLHKRGVLVNPVVLLGAGHCRRGGMLCTDDSRQSQEAAGLGVLPTAMCYLQEPNIGEAVCAQSLMTDHIRARKDTPLPWNASQLPRLTKLSIVSAGKENSYGAHICYFRASSKLQTGTDREWKAIRVSLGKWVHKPTRSLLTEGLSS